MATRTLRVAVVGAGLMGRRHAHAYRSIPGVELVAMADKNPGVCDDIERAFGVPCDTEWRPLLERRDLDAVSICLPDSLHLEATAAACANGLAVFLKKTVAT